MFLKYSGTFILNSIKNIKVFESLSNSQYNQVIVRATIATCAYLSLTVCSLCQASITFQKQSVKQIYVHEGKLNLEIRGCAIEKIQGIKIPEGTTQFTFLSSEMIDNTNFTLYNFTNQYLGTEIWKKPPGEEVWIGNKRKQNVGNEENDRDNANTGDLEKIIDAQLLDEIIRSLETPSPNNYPQP